jgi:hypothetical protein
LRTADRVEFGSRDIEVLKGQTFMEDPSSSSAILTGFGSTKRFNSFNVARNITDATGRPAR